jgi:hypothetical protein
MNQQLEELARYFPVSGEHLDSVQPQIWIACRRAGKF